MTKTFQSLIGLFAIILSVLNFEFRSLLFVCDLSFGAWNFHVFHKPGTFLFQAITCLNDIVLTRDDEKCRAHVGIQRLRGVGS